MAITDIFARRYAQRVLWRTLRPEDVSLLVQSFRIISEQVMPKNLADGKENPARTQHWRLLDERLSMELGLEHLSATHYEATAPFSPQRWWPWSEENICKNFMQCPLYNAVPDRHMKERISLVELAFRFQEEELAQRSRDLPARLAEAKRQGALLALRHPKLTEIDQSAAITAALEEAKRSFRRAVDELNERFRQAGLALHYHNGFIQISEDALIERQVEQPFWNAIADPIWKSVDTDMKEAVDRRDNNDRDAALYAAMALESTLKIISDKKGWTHGGEKGAHSYINNLVAAKNGDFIATWESNALKQFFTDVRNPLGHGPGDKPKLELTKQQTDCSIQTCMSWIKSLTGRM